MESPIDNNKFVKVVDNLEEVNQFFENRIATEFMTTRAAAQFLGISENALRIKVCRGFIPHFKFGRQLRFKTIDVRNLLLRKD
ncbi:MAG: helix-turn-helix domain-containing protein [Bdellovibrionales bacterium]|nr:helix-turn-helix domain-containing protein [Bdellovibrionales bacterium]